MITPVYTGKNACEVMQSTKFEVLSVLACIVTQHDIDDGFWWNFGISTRRLRCKKTAEVIWDNMDTCRSRCNHDPDLWIFTDTCIAIGISLGGVFVKVWTLNSLNGFKYWQVSAVADEPVRRAAPCPSCCKQRWTLSVMNWRRSSVELSWQH